MPTYQPRCKLSTLNRKCKCPNADSSQARATAQDDQKKSNGTPRASGRSSEQETDFSKEVQQPPGHNHLQLEPQKALEQSRIGQLHEMEVIPNTLQIAHATHHKRNHHTLIRHHQSTSQRVPHHQIIVCFEHCQSHSVMAN